MASEIRSQFVGISNRGGFAHGLQSARPTVMVKKFAKGLLDQLRCCCHCGHKAEHQSILCAVCTEALSAMKLKEESLFERRGELRCYSLLEWSGESLLQSLVLALKIKKDPLGLWRGFAEELFVKRGPGGMRAVLVPPARHGWERDHAGHFGHALGELLKVPCLELLAGPQDSRGQKFLSRQERQRKIFYADRLLPQEMRPAVWADDVVTTGSTARAALKALKLAPNEVELWCLARRRALAY